MKRNWMIGMAALLGLSLLVGCGRGAGSEPPATAPTAPTEVATAATEPPTEAIIPDMEDVFITLEDPAGNPVANLCVNLEYVSGDEGSYMPGDALTRSNGLVVRGAHPNATYKVLVADRKQLDDEKTTLRGEMEFTIDVVEGGPNEFTFVWAHHTPHDLDRSTEGMVALTFYDVGGKKVEDLWINLIPAADTSPEPRQIVLGHTDAEGRVYWATPEFAEFQVGAIFFVGDKEENAWHDDFTVEIVADKNNYNFVWEGKE